MPDICHNNIDNMSPEAFTHAIAVDREIKASAVRSFSWREQTLLKRHGVQIPEKFHVI